MKFHLFRNFLYMLCFLLATVSLYSAPGPITANTRIFFADVNGDGELDLLLGEQNILRVYLNQGSPGAPDYTYAIAVPFGGNNLNVLAPVFMDIDYDGDMDVFFGTDRGTIGLTKNSGTANSPQWTSNDVVHIATYSDTSFLGIQQNGRISSLVFVDYDGDGDLDMEYSDIFGMTTHVRNDDYVSSDPNSWVDGVGLNWKKLQPWDPQPRPSGFPGTNVTINWVDYDSDGDLDVMVGNELPSLAYYRNDGSATDFTNIVYVGQTLDAYFDYGYNCAFLTDFTSDGFIDMYSTGSSGVFQLATEVNRNNKAPDQTPPDMDQLALQIDRFEMNTVYLKWPVILDAFTTGEYRSGIKYYALYRSTSGPDFTPNDDVNLVWKHHRMPYFPDYAPEFGGANSDGFRITGTGSNRKYFYKDANLAGGYTYYYKLRVVDNAGNNVLSDSVQQELAEPELTSAAVTLTPSVSKDTFEMKVQTLDQYGMLYPVSSESAGVSNVTVTVTPTDFTLYDAAAQADLTDFEMNGSQVTFAQVTLQGADCVSGFTVSVAISDFVVGAAPTVVQATSNAVTLDLVAPTAPSNLSAPVGQITTSSIYLQWTVSADTCTAVANYKVYGKKTTQQTFAVVGTPTTNYFTHSNLTLNTEYQYYVTAMDQGGNESAASSTVVATTLADSTPPTTPSNVTAVWNQAQSQVTVSWTASTDSSGILKYEIYKRESLSEFSEYYDEVLGTSTTYVDNVTYPGHPLYYRIRAWDNYNNISELSVEAVADVEDVTPPSTPTGLTATAVSSSRINLSWNASSDSGTGVSFYRIYRNGGTTPHATSTSTSYSDTGLTPNTRYTYQVSAVDGASNESGKSSSAAATTPASSDPPNPPRNLRASSVTYDTITLAWDAPIDNGVTIAKFYIYKHVSTGDPTGVRIFTAFSLSQFLDGFTPSTTYYFTVSAVSTADVESTRSNMLTVATTVPKPGIPMNLRCTGSYNNWADLEWDPSATPYGIVIDYYRIYEVEQTPFGPAYYTLGYSDFNYYRVNDWNETSKTYVVRAYDTTGNWSEYSAQLQVTENIADTTAPPVPANLAGVPTGPFSVELTWNPVTDSGSGLKEYDIYRGGVFIDSTQQTTYTDEGLTPQTQYSYSLRAVDNAGNTSASTSVVQVTTPVNDTQAPPAPAGLSGVALNDSQVQLSWSAVTDLGGSGLAGYEIFRNQNMIAITTSLSYTDGNLQPQTLYTYAVRAYDNAGNRSGYSNIAEVSTKAQDLTAPPPPANVTATAQDFSTVDITWNPVQDEQGGSGLAGYQLYRDNQLLVTVETPGYTDTGLTEQTTYSYKVTAFDLSQNVSGFSNTAEVTTPPFDQTAPPAPPDLTATALDDTRIHLEWAAVSDEQGGSGLAGYRIFRNDQLIATVTTNSYTDQYLQPVTTYRYLIKARDNAGNDSAPSIEVTESTFSLPLVSAQVASNASWWTQFSIVNIGPDDNPVYFNAYSANGMWLEEVMMESFPAGASYDGEAAAIFSPETLAQDFWVRVVSKSSLRGVLAFGTPDGETFVTIPMFSRGSMDLYFPYVVFVEELWYTGISLINPHMEPVEVTLQAIDEDGYDLTAEVVNIPAGGKFIRLLEFLFDEVDPTTVRFIKVESSQPLYGFELFGNSQDYGLSGLPAFSLTTDLFGDPLLANKAAGSGDKARPATPTGFHGVPLSDSQIYLEWNPNPEPNISYVIWDKTSGFEYDIATTTETHYTVTGLQPNTLYAYYLKAKNTGGETSSQTPTVTIQTLDEGQTNYPYQLIYSEIPDPDLYFTGVTFSNMGTMTTEVYLELYDSAGMSVVDPLSVNVLSRQQMTRPLQYFFAKELLQEAAYLKVGAMEPLLGFELFMTGGGSTGQPYQYDGIVGQEYGASTLYFPLVKIAPDEFSSATWGSYISVTDLSRRENNVAIHAFGADGSQLGVYTDLLGPQSKANWSVGEIFADIATEIAWIKVAADGEIIGHMIYLDSFGARMSAYTGIRGTQ